MKEYPSKKSFLYNLITFSSTLSIVMLVTLSLFSLPAAYAQTNDELYNLLKAGSDHLAAGRFEEALQPLSKVLSSNPKGDTELAGNYLIGIAYDGLKRYPEAIEAFKKTIVLKPDFVNGQLGLAKSYYGTERYEEAIEMYKKALQLDGNSLQGNLSLGASYLQLKRYQDALEPLKKAVAIKPDQAEAQYYLGIVYVQLGDKEAATKTYETLKGLDKNIADNLLADINSLNTTVAAESTNKKEFIRLGVVKVRNRTSESVDISSLTSRLMRRLATSNIDVVPIQDGKDNKIEAEAKEKGCEYLLFTDIVGATSERPLSDTNSRTLDGSTDAVGNRLTEFRINYKLLRVGASSPQLQSSLVFRSPGNNLATGTDINRNIETEAQIIIGELSKKK